MPKIADEPKELRPYLFHGVDLTWSEGSDNAAGECPFCGKPGKFSVSVKSGLWRCFVCAEGGNRTTAGGGNTYSFLQCLWKFWDEATTDYTGLAQNRKLLEPETLLHWGACYHNAAGCWLLPGHSKEGKLTQLYRYAKGGNGKMQLLATPTMNHQLFGVPLVSKQAGTYYVCEGPWDAMVLWEVLQRAKWVDSGLATGKRELGLTANPEASLLKDINVLAVPGCNVFAPAWLALLENKDVVLLYDNDHPQINPQTGKPGNPVGTAGMQRVAALISNSEAKPRSLSYLHWGDQGYDPALPHGYDVRDHFADAATMKERVALLPTLLERVREVPLGWTNGRAIKGSTIKVGESGGEEDCLPCSDWAMLVNAWRKALKWTEGLDRALSVMLASLLSTESVGDQLWCKIIGPAACGKSTLCEAISTNRKYVLAKSTIRGFHSGYQSDREGGEDNSLIHQLRNKCLVTKDGDTLLQAPNLGQILSEARDVYDRVSRTHYRNKMSRNYEGVNMTWLLCGTSSLRQIDSSELGERFLDCVIVEDIDEDLEDEIAMRVAYRAERELSYLANGSIENREGPEMIMAKRLTGGYIGYLRENAQVLLDQVKAGDDELRQCTRYAKFVAYMRARPSTRQEEKAEREMSFRLTSQLVRLAKCLAVVLNRQTLDSEIMRRVHRCTTDTARGRMLEIAKHLFNSGADGLEMATLALFTNQTPEQERLMVRFLRRIGAVEPFHHSEKGFRGRPRWRLTERMSNLYREVMSNA